VGVEIVLHQHDLRHVGKMHARQIPARIGIIDGGVAVGDFHTPPWAKPSCLRTRPIENLVEVDLKTFLDDVPEVDASLAHHAIPGGTGTGFHNPLQLLLLLSRQLDDRPGRFAIDEPLIPNL
jgi:hypothetical protein